MINPLLGCAASEVSPARAGAVFSEFAKKLATEQNLDITTAWRRARELHPDLYQRLAEKDSPPPTSPLENATQTFPVPLAAKSLIAPRFYLPISVSNEDFTIAYRANGGATDVNPQKIFEALVVAKATKQKVTVDEARRIVADQFPNLAAAANGNAAALGNSEDPRNTYEREFKNALPRNGMDPVKAHNQVMAIPGLREKLAAKNT